MEDQIEVVEEGPVVANPAPRKTPSTKWQTFKKAIYNPQTKQILGRTCGSWNRLLLFYTIFYAVLAGLFASSISVLLSTLDSTGPKWKLEESLIGTNPGLGFRPISIEQGSLIWYNYNKPSTTAQWVKILNEFLEPYKHHPHEKNVQKCSSKKPPKPNNVCLVDIEQFGPCTAENHYGYNSSSPCVFIKLNKIFGWIPMFYTEPKDGMPDDLNSSIRELPKHQRNQVWVSCSGEDPADRENIVGFNYYPSRGLPGYYYPYLNVKNYLSPIIAVEIVNATPSVLVNIECRAWAKNIRYKRSKFDRQGSVHFEILADAD